MGPKRRAPSRVYKLSAADLDKVARLIHERYFVSHWIPSTVEPIPPPRAHGGRSRLSPPDFWQLLIVDEGAPERGALVDHILRRSTIPARLLCELARLKARVRQREVARERSQALQIEREKWEGSMAVLDQDGRARFNRKLREIARAFPRPDYHKEIASSLREWGLYIGSPSRVTLHRLSAGLNWRQLAAHILRIHRWGKRAFRFITP